MVVVVEVVLSLPPSILGVASVVDVVVELLLSDLLAPGTTTVVDGLAGGGLTTVVSAGGFTMVVLGPLVGTATVSGAGRVIANMMPPTTNTKATTPMMSAELPVSLASGSLAMGMLLS